MTPSGEILLIAGFRLATAECSCSPACHACVLCAQCPDIHITVLDVSEARIKQWNSDTELPIFEPGLLEVVKAARARGNLCFSTVSSHGVIHHRACTHASNCWRHNKGSIEFHSQGASSSAATVSRGVPRYRRGRPLPI
jgi:hypothetical protein